jgi:hypothetical protein
VKDLFRRARPWEDGARVFRFLVLSLTSLALLAPSAGATVFSGSGTDPTGDGPSAGQDVTGVSASYDGAAGTVTASLTTAAGPDPLFFYIQVGTLSGSTCGAPFTALGGYTDGSSGVWGIDTDAQSDLSADAQVTRSGSTVTITAAGARLAGRSPNCVTGHLTPKSASNTLDAVDAPAALAAQADPAPPPAPAPGPAPVTQTTPAPAPKPAPAPAPAKKAARLAVAISGVPTTIRRNRTMSLKVKVSNTGTAAATGVKLKVGTARGLTATPRTITVKTLKAGTSTTRRVKVRLTAKARTTTTLAFRASGARKLAATGRVALRIGKAKKPKPTKKTPGPAPAPTKQNPLVGTYWWYVISHVDWAWDNHGVYFLDDRWAYRGIPKGGLPTSCAAQTAGVDDKGEQTDGCIPYTYDAATGAVTLGTAAGTFKDGKLQITDEGDLQDYTKLLVPAAGARYDVNLVHRGFQGMCGLILGCTTWENWLRLMPDGQFVYSRSTTTTMGDPGLGPFTAAGSYPPDEHGTYEVLAGGHIRLAYADGSVKDHTFAVQYDKAGNPDPTGEGVFLDEDNFYRDEMP